MRWAGVEIGSIPSMPAVLPPSSAHGGPANGRPSTPVPELALFSERAERVLLGAVILDGRRMDELKGVRAEDFGLDGHRKLFRCMLKMYASGRDIDAVTLPEFMGPALVNECGGNAYLASLSEGLPSYGMRLDEHIRILRERAQLRKAQKIAETILARVENGEEPAPLVAWACDKYAELASRSDSNRMRLLKGSEIAEQEQPMILPDHIPDQTTIGMHGRPGDGKTTGAILIAANLSRGLTPYTGKPCTPRNILVMSNEDSPARIRKLFSAVDGDLSRLWVEDCDDVWQLADLARLEGAITSHSIGCVVVDSLASHSGKADLNSHQDTAQLLVPLRALAEKYGCVIIVIHHLNKNISTDHIAKVSGSIGITASFRHHIHVVPDPENPDLRLLVNGKSNLIRPNVPALRFKVFPVEWEGEVHISIDDVYRDAEPEEKPGRAVGWLREALKDGDWHDAGRLQQQATQGFNLSKRSVFRAADQLGVERRKEGFGGRASWRLSMSASPNTTPPPPTDGTHVNDGDLEDLESKGDRISPMRAISATREGAGTHAAARKAFDEDEAGETEVRL